MYKLPELYELKNELVKKTEKILEDVKNSGGIATPEQEAKFDCMESELKILNKKIEEERLSLPTSKPILMTPQNNVFTPFNVKPRMNKLNSKSFRGMFYGNENTQLSNNGFADMNEFLNILHLGRADRRLLQNSMVEGIPEYGGFAVPEEFGAFLMDKSLENEIIRPRASVWAMGSETKKVPAFDGSDHSNNLFGGISGEWLEEGKTGTRKTAKLRLIQLNAKKLACFSQASNELIADGMSFEEMLAGALIKGLGWYMDYAFINGTGEGEPLGILNDPALIVVTKEKEQISGTITYNNIVSMFSRLTPSCFKNAV